MPTLLRSRLSETSNCEDRKRMFFTVFAQYVQCDITDFHTRHGHVREAAMMCVAVKRQHGLVAVQHPLQSRTAEERKDRFRLADNGLFDGRIVSDCDLERRIELRQPVVKLDGFALGNLDKCFDSLFSKGQQLMRCESSAKTLRARES